MEDFIVKQEIRGTRVTKAKDRHHEDEKYYIDGNVKKYVNSVYEDDLEDDIEDLVELDPSFNWKKIK